MYRQGLTVMVDNQKKLSTHARTIVVEFKRHTGSPPAYEPDWQRAWGAIVERVEINHGARPSTAVVTFTLDRWNESNFGLKKADMIRIRTDDIDADDITVIFQGFITADIEDFSGGTERTKAFENYSVECQDHRWLLGSTSWLYGQVGRGPDDYTDYGTAAQAPIADSWTFLSGRRAIFNADGKPNRDPQLLVLGSGYGSVPIFTEPANGEPWTAREMLIYCLSPLFNQAYNYLPISDPEQLTGLDHPDLDKVMNHIIVDGLNVLDAISYICEDAGFSFREDYTTDGVTFAFYKIAAADSYTRSSDDPTILHQLHAPAVGEDIDTAVEQGRKMLWAATMKDDISLVVNNPWGLGAPQLFEFTAELVPAWLDSELDPDTEESNANLFFTEADLQDITDKNSKDYYKYYHPRGSGFKRDVGRKWVLNESGKYSNSATYDRGMPFAFEDFIPSAYIKDADGKRIYAPFNRQLLPCLTADKDDLNSIGIKLEFSLDGGSTWQVIPAAVSALDDECGIYIDEANLAEMVDEDEADISPPAEDNQTLDGIQLNFWTSLCNDKLNTGWAFKDGETKTRIRITASIQMDQRLARESISTSRSGSPFNQVAIFDMSGKYEFSQRCPSSIFDGSALPSMEQDHTTDFDNHLDAIRAANEDMSISARFTLDRAWFGSGFAAFCPGDCIERITGREKDLSATIASGQTVYPEIIQITYILGDRQTMRLVTRDLRFAEVTV